MPEWPVLTAMYCRPSIAKEIGNPVTGDPQVDLPKDLAGALVERLEPAVQVPAEQQSASRRHQRSRRRPLLVDPEDPPRLRRDRVDRPRHVLPGRQCVVHGEAQNRERGIRRVRRHDGHADVAHRKVHGVRQRTVGPRLPIPAADRAGTDQGHLSERREDEILVLGHHARDPVDIEDDVLRHRRRRPEELPRRPVQRVHDAGLARDPGHDLAFLAGNQIGVQPPYRVRVRRDDGVHEQPFERVVQVPSDPAGAGSTSGSPRCLRRAPAWSCGTGSPCPRRRA